MNIFIFIPNKLDGQKFLRFERCQGPGENMRPPISAAYIAAVLKENRFENVLIKDFRLYGSGLEEMIKCVGEFKTDLLLLPSVTPTMKDDVVISKALKQTYPDLDIAFFGPHVTVRPEDVLSDEIRYVIRNEPEYTCLELVRALEQSSDLGIVEGLSYFSNRAAVHNPDREGITDLDALPFPDRDMIENEKYIISTMGRAFTLIKTSRGCPFDCIYCTAQSYYGKKWRVRSVDNIIAEIKLVKEKYGINDFFFNSDTFNLNKKWTFKLCNRILNEELNIRWMANSRVDTITEEMALLMKKSGCWLVAFGIESGSQEMLDRMKKGITVEQAVNAIQIAKKCGLRTTSNFIFGIPGESKETIWETMKFLNDIRPDYVKVNPVVPYPGTPFWDIVEEKGYLTTTDWDKFSQGVAAIVEYPDLTREEIQRAAQHATRRFYLRPGKIIDELKMVSSLSEFLFLIRGGFKYIQMKLFQFVKLEK